MRRPVALRSACGRSRHSPTEPSPSWSMHDRRTARVARKLARLDPAALDGERQGAAPGRLAPVGAVSRRTAIGSPARPVLVDSGVRPRARATASEAVFAGLDPAPGRWGRRRARTPRRARPARPRGPGRGPTPVDLATSRSRTRPRATPAPSPAKPSAIRPTAARAGLDRRPPAEAVAAPVLAVGLAPGPGPLRGPRPPSPMWRVTSGSAASRTSTSVCDSAHGSSLSRGVRRMLGGRHRSTIIAATDRGRSAADMQPFCDGSLRL